MTTDLVQGFATAHGQEVDIRHDPLNVLHRIIDALDPQTGLKENDGSLKEAYPYKVGLFQTRDDLLSDAAMLANMACYRMTAYGGRDGFRQAIMNVDAIVEAVRAIPAEKAGEAFRALRFEVEEQRDREDGRQTDYDDIAKWNDQQDLMKRYRKERSRSPVSSTSFQKQIELKAS